MKSFAFACVSGVESPPPNKPFSAPSIPFLSFCRAASHRAERTTAVRLQVLCLEGLNCGTCHAIGEAEAKSCGCLQCAGFCTLEVLMTRRLILILTIFLALSAPFVQRPLPTRADDTQAVQISAQAILDYAV